MSMPTPFFASAPRPVARAKSAGIPGADTPRPNLCIEPVDEKAVRGCQFVVIDLISSRLNVDNDEFTFVVRSNMGAYVSVVNLIATASKLLFAVPRFWYGHFIFLCIIGGQNHSPKDTELNGTNPFSQTPEDRHGDLCL